MSRLEFLILAVAIVAVATIGAIALLRARHRGGRVARVLIAIAGGSALLVGLVLLRPLADDSGMGFAAVVTLIPVALTALTALAVWLNRIAGVVVTWVATAVMFAYVLLFGLGFGLFYLPTALLLLAAGVALATSRVVRA